MTIRQTIKRIRDIGMACSYSSEYAEYRVDFPHQPNDRTTYFTEDPEDAINTAEYMKRNESPLA